MQLYHKQFERYLQFFHRCNRVQEKSFNKCSCTIRQYFVGIVCKILKVRTFDIFYGFKMEVVPFFHLWEVKKNILKFKFYCLNKRIYVVPNNLQINTYSEWLFINKKVDISRMWNIELLLFLCKFVNSFCSFPDIYFLHSKLQLQRVLSCFE